MVPPKTRVTPPTWTAFLNAHKDLWALDFTCVFDIQGDEPGTGFAPNGHTRIAARQGTRKPGKSFILEVKNVSELEEFEGVDQLMPGSSIGGVVASFQGKPKLRDNFDWIIWASNDLASGLKKVEIPGCR